jgi:nitrogen fixation NifU-like protein
MDDLYRDEILEHYRHPHNFGTLEHPDVSQDGSNPLCGDRITLQLAIDEDGVIRQVAFSGRGCAISQASASMLTDRVRGLALPDVAKIGRQDVLDDLGIEISPARLKCALLSIDTLRRALEDRVAWQASTEDDGQ